MLFDDKEWLNDMSDGLDVIEAWKNAEKERLAQESQKKTGGGGKR